MALTTSVVVCTKNEEEVIKDCLLSLDFADEIVLVDSNSSDRTVLIGRKNKARVFVNKWQGFSEQKNFAFKKTSGDWVLFVDGDERVPDDLKKEIVEKINDKDNKYNAFEMPRLNNFLGKDMHWGGWYPDYQKRLVKRDAFIGWEGALHEHIRSKGKTGRLKNDLYHLAHRRIREMVEKSIMYTNFEAEQMYKHDHPEMVWWRFFRPMMGEFYGRYIKKRGYKDGAVGFIEAIYQSYSVFLIYARLWEMQQKKEKEI